MQNLPASKGNASSESTGNPLTEPTLENIEPSAADQKLYGGESSIQKETVPSNNLILSSDSAQISTEDMVENQPKSPTSEPQEPVECNKKTTTTESPETADCQNLSENRANDDASGSTQMRSSELEASPKTAEIKLGDITYSSDCFSKVRCLIDLLQEESRDQLLTYGQAYPLYLGKASLLDLIGKDVETEESKIAWTCALKDLQKIVSLKLQAILSQLSNMKCSKEMCDDVIGLASMVVHLKEVASSTKVTGSLDVNLLSECIDLFAAACNQSYDIRQSAISKKLIPENSPEEYPMVQRRNGTKVYIGDACEKFDRKLDKLLLEMLTKKYAFNTMDDLAKEGPKKDLVISMDIFKKATEVLVKTCGEVDRRIKEKYLPIFRHVFLHVADQNQAMEHVYSHKYFSESKENVPTLRTYYKNFDTDFTRLLNGITDHDSYSTSDTTTQMKEFAFLMTIAPQSSIRHIVLFGLKAKPMIPSLIFILRKLPAFFKLRAHPTHFSAKQKELLIISYLRHLMVQENEHLNMSEELDRETMENLITSFTRTSYKEKYVNEKVLAHYPLIDATDLLRDLIMSSLTRGMLNEFMLGVIHKIVQVHAAREWKIKWKMSTISSFSAESESNDTTVDPLSLICLLLATYQKNSSDRNIPSLIANVLRAFAQKLKSDKIRFSEPEWEYILYRMNCLDWSLKYCATRWFSESAFHTRAQITRALYNSLAEHCRDNFRPIVHPGSHAATEDFLRSIFEVAVIEPELALNLLKNDFENLPTVNETNIADALIQSIRPRMEAKIVNKLRDVIDAIILRLQMGSTQKFTNFYDEALQAHRQKFNAIAILFEAVDISVRKCSKKQNQDANCELIIAAFSEIANKYINKELQPTKPKQGHNEEQTLVQDAIDAAAYFYITILHRMIRKLLKIMSSPPTCLLNLQKQLSSLGSQSMLQLEGKEKHEEVQQFMAGLDGEPQNDERDSVLQLPKAEQNTVGQTKFGHGSAALGSGQIGEAQIEEWGSASHLPKSEQTPAAQSKFGHGYGAQIEEWGSTSHLPKAEQTPAAQSKFGHGYGAQIDEWGSASQLPKTEQTPAAQSKFGHGYGAQRHGKNGEAQIEEWGSAPHLPKAEQTPDGQSKFGRGSGAQNEEWGTASQQPKTEQTSDGPTKFDHGDAGQRNLQWGSASQLSKAEQNTGRQSKFDHGYRAQRRSQNDEAQNEEWGSASHRPKAEHNAGGQSRFGHGSAAQNEEWGTASQRPKSERNFGRQSKFGPESAAQNKDWGSASQVSKSERNYGRQSKFGHGSGAQNEEWGTASQRPKAEHNAGGQSKFGPGSGAQNEEWGTASQRPKAEHNVGGQSKFGPGSGAQNEEWGTASQRPKAEHNVGGQSKFGPGSGAQNEEWGTASQRPKEERTFGRHYANNKYGQESSAQRSLKWDSSSQLPKTEQNADGPSKFDHGDAAQKNLQWGSTSQLPKAEQNDDGQSKFGHGNGAQRSGQPAKAKYNTDYRRKRGSPPHDPPTDPETSVIVQKRVFFRGGDELKLDQPWSLAPAKVYSSMDEILSADLTSGRFIVGNFSYSPGLGNLMFQFAALCALAEEFDAWLVLSSDSLLRRAFEGFNRTLFIVPKSVESVFVEHRSRIREFKNCCKYESIKLFESPEITVEVIAGYFQSYKYFHPHREKLIRYSYTFLSGVTEVAHKYLWHAKIARRKHIVLETSENNENPRIPDNNGSDYEFVGIHVRHGMDITWHSRNMRHGHISAPPEYYLNAIAHFKQLRPDKEFIFVVASDDLRWAKLHIASETKGEMFYLDSKHREIDLATLAMCNHSIISTGTFSWWSGYLTGGKVVRYSGWPRPESDLAKMINISEYYLPEWSGIE
ncbi:glycosyl transferase family 11 domain-containing protein [Ditylenchus destructor]|nr:glycosyl transferase family 11 domain-containing protein [Ditylenchus destructor]